MLLKVKGELEIAHKLPNYKGVCQFCHGHRYEYEFTFEGYVDENTGMVEDFKFLKECINFVTDKYDHSYLNDYFDNPTLEIFAQEFLNEVNDSYDYFKGFKKKGNFISLEIWETSKYGVKVYA